MTDIFDNATELETQQRQWALDAQRKRSKEPPQDIDDDGTVWCIDCAEQIEPDRLHAKPNAARCIDCQSLAELQEHC